MDQNTNRSDWKFDWCWFVFAVALSNFGITPKANVWRRIKATKTKNTASSPTSLSLVERWVSSNWYKFNYWMVCNLFKFLFLSVDCVGVRRQPSVHLEFAVQGRCAAACWSHRYVFAFRHLLLLVHVDRLSLHFMPFSCRRCPLLRVPSEGEHYCVSGAGKRQNHQTVA